jgi:hypothetical protein
MKSIPHGPVEQLKDFIRRKYAVPGMYPQYLVMDDGGNLCHACARDNFKLILRATRRRFDIRTPALLSDDWATVGTDVNWDESLYCDHCGERIESAYAEPECEAAPPGRILVSQTFEVAPADCESEDDLETGFEFQSRAVTFRELVQLMEDHPHPSCSPLHYADQFIWFTSHPEQDYRTGATRTTSIFFDKSNPTRKAKYWDWAMRAAGKRYRIR